MKPITCVELRQISCRESDFGSWDGWCQSQKRVSAFQEPPVQIQRGSTSHSIQLTEIPSVSFSSPTRLLQECNSRVLFEVFCTFFSIGTVTTFLTRTQRYRSSRRDKAPLYSVSNDKKDCANQPSHISLLNFFDSIQWIHPRPRSLRLMRSHGDKGAPAPLRRT